MGTIPFTLYDFLGCLAAGFLVLVSVDYAYNLHWLLVSDTPLSVTFFWIVVSYVLGHIVANMAGYVLERLFLRKVLLSPEETLLWNDSEFRARRGWRKLFPGHHDRLPTETQDRVWRKAEQLDFPKSENKRALFFHCLPIVQRSEITRQRLERFLILYGFSRNGCFAAVIAALVITSAMVLDALDGAGFLPTGNVGNHLWAALVGSLIAAVGLFYRYLKFFRDYTIDVFRSYAEHGS